ncbi:hypothetical protein M434DRAFT_12379 [Hypoxylon sp. CO27-5]|nr:hypothetical protein M434DRAFT_12379 [Hypoxylon sp. CO27-5]
MPLFSRSHNAPSTSSSSRNQGSRIQTVDIDRPHQTYSSNPEDTDIPSFTRTDSYYQTGTTEPEYQYLAAADVRRQVREAPLALNSSGRYPSIYHNKPPLPLRSQPPYREFPIVPSPQGGSAPGNYRYDKPGPVRAFYNDNNRTQFDVGYHDPNRATRGPRDGREFADTHFSLAQYHPAPTYTNVRHV